MFDKFFYTCEMHFMNNTFCISQFFKPKLKILILHYLSNFCQRLWGPLLAHQMRSNITFQPISFILVLRSSPFFFSLGFLYDPQQPNVPSAFSSLSLSALRSLLQHFPFSRTSDLIQLTLYALNQFIGR